jgi:hypothetical protein
MPITIRLSRELSPLAEAVSNTFGTLAKLSAVKPSSVAVMVEARLKAGFHAVVLDSIRVWWGLHAPAERIREGLSVPKTRINCNA